MRDVMTPHVNSHTRPETPCAPRRRRREHYNLRLHRAKEEQVLRLKEMDCIERQHRRRILALKTSIEQLTDEVCARMSCL